jgi:hypothetical protein
MSWLESLVDNEVRCQPWVCHGCLWAAMALAVPCVATDKRGVLRFDIKIPYRILWSTNCARTSCWRRMVTETNRWLKPSC